MRNLAGRGWWLVLLLVATALFGCSASGASNPESSHRSGGTQSLRVAQIRTNLQPLMDAAGELDNLSYRVSWSSFENGPQAIEAERGGSVDLAYMADTPPIFAQAAGVAVHIVATTRAPRGARNVSLLVRRQSSVRTVSDLRGKRVAIVPGTITQYLLVEALKEVGLTYDAVEQLNLQGPEAITALQRGDADAAVLVDPLAATAVASGVAEVLRTGEGLLSGSNALVAADPALADRSRAAEVGDFLQRVKAAIEWSATNEAGWAAVYANVNHLPPRVARETVQRGTTHLVPIDAEAIRWQQRQADAFFQLGLLPEKLDAAKQYDARYNRRLFPNIPQRPTASPAR
jgi:sulfonate transport system substrate-binding protein